jgi:hypothetical protein
MKENYSYPLFLQNATWAVSPSPQNVLRSIPIERLKGGESTRCLERLGRGRIQRVAVKPRHERISSTLFTPHVQCFRAPKQRKFSKWRWKKYRPPSFAVKLRSFGLFSVRNKRERLGRNPRTGVEVPIKPRRVLTFKPSPVLSASVNGQTAEEDPDKNESI